MNRTYELYEDNAGFLHLAVLHDGQPVYYYSDNNQEGVLSALADLKAGSDPIEDGWDGCAEDLQTCYETINRWVDERNGGAREVESGSY